MFNNLQTSSDVQLNKLAGSSLQSNSGKLVSNVRSLRVQWFGSNKVISENLDLNDSLDVDSVTRSINLQTKLMKLVSSTWSSEIRAFVSFDHKKLELTLGPCDVNKYFKSFCEHGPPFVWDESLDRAWSQLHNCREPVSILVTRYSPVECAIGYLEMRYFRSNWHYGCVTTLFDKLPAKLQMNDKVIEAYVKAGLVSRELLARCTTPAVHLAYAKYQGMSTWSFAPQALQQDKSFVLHITRQLVLSPAHCVNGLILPPHVDDVYSDCLHNCLYRTDYTRAEILARVAVCGDVLQLHPSWCQSDPEIVMAAFKSTRNDLPSYYYGAPTMPLSMWNDKQFVLEVVSHCGSAIKLVPSVLADDSDVGLAAVSQDRKAFSYLSERLRGTTDIVLRAASHGKTLHRVPLAVQTNKSLVLKLVALSTQAFVGFEDVPDQAKLKQRVYNFKTFMHDQKFMIECVEANWRMAFRLPRKARQSYFGQTVCAAACKHFGKARLACYHYFLRHFNDQF